MNELLRDLYVKDLRWEQWGVKAQVQVGLGCDSTLQMFLLNYLVLMSEMKCLFESCCQSTNQQFQQGYIWKSMLQTHKKIKDNMMVYKHLKLKRIESWQRIFFL